MYKYIIINLKKIIKMGNLFTMEYDENIEKSISNAMSITNPDERIKLLKEINVPEKSRYKQLIDDCIIDATLKPLW